MSEATKLQRAYDALCSDFLLPVLRGGVAHVDKPIAPGALDYFEHATPSDPDVAHALGEALAAECSALCSVLRPPSLDAGAAALACACLDLAVLTDPELDSTFGRGAREQIASWVGTIADACKPPRTREEALVRHAIVARFLELKRRDVVVHNWAYTYRFRGRPVPARVTAMPRLRLVHTMESSLSLEAAVAALPGTLDAEARLRKIFRASPVTALLRIGETPDVSPFGPGSAEVLSDPRLRSAVARVLVAGGPKTRAALGRAMAERALRGGDAATICLALALVYEVLVTQLAQPGQTPPELPDPGLAWMDALLVALATGRVLPAPLSADDEARLRTAARIAGQRVPTELVDEARALVLAAATAKESAA